MTAEPPPVTLKLTCTALPSDILPSQVPGIFLIASNAFCAPLCAEAEVAASASAARITACRVRIEFVQIGFFVIFVDIGVFLSEFNLFRFTRGGLCFPLVLGFNKGFQVIQACGPKHAILLDPGIDRAQRLRIKLIDAVAAFAMLAHQMCPAQQAKMFGDSRP